MPDVTRLLEAAAPGDLPTEILHARLEPRIEDSPYQRP